mmetsp:Transcript_11386/g.16794  ORF Transcript_11386/g.16794 Transcript_11386/m.16794 type:complete len:313 (-) Transcript_11386:490-1428(-)|eukprot:CAMPEP_0113940852 /NCGR_PEP_ID=MMETSP1339-20121228/6896_1 /TAXON_ID=94617 /ORGANISM="Fibrocapsa japonica" /LENGTH=312 /DNA_ID=CAMNT_0000944815 /DNA_START=160 /DNA_END=1098 /DNA_ORIENTATION=- /assembly_acc=CAM_ASM_000762
MLKNSSTLSAKTACQALNVWKNVISGKVWKNEVKSSAQLALTPVGHLYDIFFELLLKNYPQHEQYFNGGIRQRAAVFRFFNCIQSICENPSERSIHINAVGELHAEISSKNIPRFLYPLIFDTISTAILNGVGIEPVEAKAWEDVCMYVKSLVMDQTRPEKLKGQEILSSLIRPLSSSCLLMESARPMFSRNDSFIDMARTKHCGQMGSNSNNKNNNNKSRGGLRSTDASCRYLCNTKNSCRQIESKISTSRRVSTKLPQNIHYLEIEHTCSQKNPSPSYLQKMTSYVMRRLRLCVPASQYEEIPREGAAAS